jgi:1-acyl-sn-glycerol-3-phosphate acyltransferase
MSENGISTSPSFSIAKLLKLLNADVYICYTEGSYLTQPKWSKVRRKGKITVDVYKLISKEDLATISNEELFQLVGKNINYNSYENQKKNMIPFKNGNNVQGLEYVLYQCPKCKTIKSIVSEETTKLKCTCCGYKVEADNYGLLNGEELIFDTPSDWSIKIIDNLKAELINNPDFHLQDSVTIFMINYKKRKFEEVGTGVISIDKKNIVLKGVVNNENIEHCFFTSSYPMLPFVPGEYLEIQDGQNIYRLKFHDPYNVMIFINILKIINNSWRD